MFPLSVTTWVIVAEALVIALLGVALKYAFNKYEDEHRLFLEFKTQVKLNGEAAQAVALAKDKANQLLKEKNDKERKLLKATIATFTKRMRDSNTPVSNLPETPANSRRPDLLCLDRAEYKREDGVALEHLFEGARSLADEGTAATVDLNSAKVWTKELN